MEGCFSLARSFLALSGRLALVASDMNWPLRMAYDL
jgi:hypothetical protein